MYTLMLIIVLCYPQLPPPPGMPMPAPVVIAKTVGSQDFSSLSACQQAQTAIARNSNSQVRIGTYCVQK